MKRFSKLLAGLLVFILISTMCSIGLTAYAATDDVVGDYKFDITSTYKNIDWNNWKAYKAETHVHTVRSDADTEVDDMIEYYYGFGFDAMALTDHGTVNYGWASGQSRVAIFDYQFFVHGAIDNLSEARYKEITTGTGAVDGGSSPRGFGMREIPLGIELNGMSTKKVHINGFYADYGHGDLGTAVTWPREAVEGNYKANGLTHINHVGEWSDGKDDIGTYDAEFVRDFASIYQDYGIMRKGRDEFNLRGCLGMELVNTADSRTKNDRYLYDEILKVLAPQGINVLAFCEDDAHELSDCDRNAQYFIMPENDMATNNIKHSMMYGEFYASSKNSKNTYELGSGFNAVGAYPSVSYIGTDADKNQIIITSKDANKIRFVADGEIIETDDISTAGATTVFDLNKYENRLNSYVRAYLTGPGGITYLQPFLIEKQAKPVSTVSFNKPSADTQVSVFDSNGSLVSPINTEGTYTLDAGNYTYIASRAGYITTEPTAFTVSQSDIDTGRKRVIDVTLEKDTSIVTTEFYVPETIYLNEADSMTFSSYVDRQNAVDGAINTGASATGGIYFSREGASNVNITYEVVEGTALGSMTIGQTSSNSSVISTYITAGTMSAPLSSGGHSLIRWKASYTSGGKTLETYAYTYVYGPLRGSNSTVAAGGFAQTKKNILSWAHTTMDLTATVWMTGVHSVSGGGSAYKFTPAGGTSLAPASEVGNITATGVGMSTASNDSSGGSVTVEPSGTAGTITVDTSRYSNLSQVPNLKYGIDINYCSQGEDQANVYMEVAKNRVYNLSTVISGAYNGVRIYQNAIDWYIDQSLNSIPITGYASCKKESRTDAVKGSFTLNLQYVNKASLRDEYFNAVCASYQADWFENAADYNNYINSIKSAAIALGNPAATANEIASAENALANALNNVKLKKGTLTVNHINSLTNETLKTEQSEYTVSDSLIANAEEFDGLTYSDSWNLRVDGVTVSNGTETFCKVSAYEDNYTINFYYAPKEYTVSYNISDPAFPQNIEKAVYGKNYRVVSYVPSQAGYTFGGWLLEADGNIYQPGSTFVWSFENGSGFTPVWTANQYTATYNLNGGTGIDTLTESVSYMDSYNVNSTVPEKEGYVFAGWSTKTASGKDLGTSTPGSTISWDETDSITFTAVWNVITVEVTLDAYGGTLSQNKLTVDFGTEYGTLPVPVKAGYTFDGWFSDAELTQPVTENTEVSNYENHTLYAKWSKGEYTVTYLVNGEFYTSTTYNYGDTVIAAAAPDTEGYTFSGWSEIPSVMPAEDVTVTGTLTVNKYKLTYILDGVEYQKSDVEYGTAIKALVPAEKTGYTFSGWSNLPATMPANNVTVIGFYDANEYTVYYYVDGAIYSTETHSYGDTIVPLVLPAKTGYTFSGWSDLPETMPAGDVYASGTYSVSKYKVKYYIDGELYCEDEFAYKETIIPQADPEKEGYEFSGWTYIPATMPSRDYTVNGSFTANDYSYFFIVDGTIRSDLTIKAKFGDSITAPTFTAPKNYTFSGWSPEVPAKMGSESKYFYGTTTKTDSVITYNLNGGTGIVPSSETFAVGTKAVLPSEGITKAGFLFAGWSDSSSAQSGFDTYTVGTDDVTLYAVWTAVTVRIDPAEESTTIVDNVLSLIYGVQERLSEVDFQSMFIDLIGTGANVKYETGISFGTGTKVTLYQDTTEVMEYQLVVYGDVDGDGVADGQDVQLAQMIKEGYLTKAQVGEAVYEAADCDHDGSITDNDIQIIIDSGIKLQVVDQTR